MSSSYNQYTTPLLSPESSPGSVEVTSSYEDFNSSDEFEITNKGFVNDTITNTPSYPGFVSTNMNYLDTVLLYQPNNKQTYQPQQMFNLLDQQPVGFTVEYINFPDKQYKTQKRAKGVPSKQVIEKTTVSFCLNFGSTANRNNIKDIRIKLKRNNESDTKYVGEVPLNAKFEPVQDTKILAVVNLDVYEYNGHKVYDLERSLTNEYNMYHLIIEVTDKNLQLYKHCTKGFKMIGRKKKVVVKQPKPGEKRGHSGSLTSTDSCEESNSLTSSGNGSVVIPLPQTQGLIQARKVVAEHIATKTLEVDGLQMGKAISSSHGDIAYHFPLRDATKKFEEAEIIGLFEDPKDKGTFVIDKLSLKNSSEVILKGVITRSQYLEAQVPKTDIATETICMMGVVPVQVIGSVLHNEALYASPNHPGCAVSGHHLDYSDVSEDAFIGYSFSSRKTNDETSKGFVQAGVSVLETAGKYMLDQRIRDLEEDFDGKLTKVEKIGKRNRKCVIICGIISTILLTLLGIFLWQLFMPGSAYRYYVCKLGRKSPHGEARYTFIPFNNIFANPQVNGIEFHFKSLLRKTHHTEYKRLNTTAFNIKSVRYYLNIDRCAYGGLRQSADHNTAQKAVYGADIFAVDDKCFHAYYYNENKVNGWVKYNSVSWKDRQNIFCNPPSSYKNDVEKEKPEADLL